MTRGDYNIVVRQVLDIIDIPQNTQVVVHVISRPSGNWRQSPEPAAWGVLFCKMVYRLGCGGGRESHSLVQACSDASALFFLIFSSSFRHKWMYKHMNTCRWSWTIQVLQLSPTCWLRWVDTSWLQTDSPLNTPLLLGIGFILISYLTCYIILYCMQKYTHFLQRQPLKETVSLSLPSKFCRPLPLPEPLPY